MRDMLGAMRDMLKISNGNIFGINLFLAKVKADLICRGNNQLVDIRFILRKANLFLSLVDFFQ